MPSNYDQIRAENIERFGSGSCHMELLSHLYADHAQFLFELIQNAEDAEATWIQCDLYPDRLAMRHNGRPFTAADVRAISAIAEGTKRDDLTKIGKFGIGFKSVYRYTKAPRIHSGGEHFEVRNHVQLYGIPPLDEDIGTDTVLILPFDRTDRNLIKTLGEIGRTMLTFSMRNLLFLRNIEKIASHLNPGRKRSVWRKSTPDGRMRKVGIFTVSEGTEMASENWLVMERPVDLPTGGVGRAEAAFLLQRSRAGTEQIACLPDSNLVVFFPTARATGLGFLIQGPYRTTPARDNVPQNDGWNQTLINETAVLISDSLVEFSQRDLMTPGFMRGLPMFPKCTMFRPLYDRVCEALRHLPVIPGYPASHHVAGANAKFPHSSALRELLTPAQLKQLYRCQEPVCWISADITPGRTPELFQFLQEQIGVETVTAEEFAGLIDEEFLKSQPDAWMETFYIYLAELANPEIYLDKPILRLEDGSHVAPRDADGAIAAFLPGDTGARLPTVKTSLLERGDVRDVLSHLGLTEARVLSPYVLDDFLSELRGVTFQFAANRALEIWNALIRGAGDIKPGSLRRLQETPWLPSRHGALHKPSELMLDQLAPGFPPDAAVAKSLRMKESMLEDVAAQMGVSLTLLNFVVQNPELVDRLRQAKQARAAAT